MKNQKKLIKQGLLYAGKAKSLFATPDSQLLVMHFRDDISAFNAKKTAVLAGKGQVNNYFNAFMMQYLHTRGIKTHFVQLLSDTETQVRALTMLPVECVVRNVAAGSLLKRLGIPKGQLLNPPIFEYFLKDDALGDPLINASHIKTFKWATLEQLEQLESITDQVNQALQSLFESTDLLLVDFKLEFGVADSELWLGDELTPDSCRIWDVNTQASLDKDRFRHDQGDVVAAYQEIANRLNIPLSVDSVNSLYKRGFEKGSVGNNCT